MCDDPSKVFRHKKDTSMGVGLTLLRDGKADALVSAGSTGALLAGATLITKRIRGIRRAAMAPVIPTTGRQGRAHRLRGQRRVHPGVSDAVCVSGQLLCQPGAGTGASPGGPAEHRRGGQQGHGPAKADSGPAAQGRGGGPPELHRQHRGQGGHQGRLRRHRHRRLLRQHPAQDHGGRGLLCPVTPWGIFSGRTC